MKKILTLAAAAALSTVSMNAVAGQAFVRAEAGQSDTEVSVDGSRASETDTALIIGGGYWFTPNIGVEGHAGSLYNEDLGWGYELDLVSIGAGVVVKKNFGANDTGFFVGGRAGLARITAQVRDDWDVEEDESSTKPYFGVNAGYDFSNHWGLSLNYDRRKADINGLDIKIETITFGGEYRF